MTSRQVSWAEIAGRLSRARSFWLATIGPDGAPRASPVWGVVLDGVWYFYSERTTVKARSLSVDVRVAVHLEDAEDVLIVHGTLQDLGRPQARADVVAAFSAKYDRPGDAKELPSSNPAFDVLYALAPTRAMTWTLEDFDRSQRRWSAGSAAQ